MPRPSAIWVCDSPNCWRIRRKRGPTKSFFPESAGMALFPGSRTAGSFEIGCLSGFLHENGVDTGRYVTKFTRLLLSHVYVLHDITIRNQAVFTNWRESRLSPDEHFAMHCHECLKRRCRSSDLSHLKKDYEHELPATRDR